jgi:putative ABC transport system permease protein
MGRLLSSFSLTFQVFSESIRAALQAIASSKLRSFLSTLGISVGIFCIILVFTLVDSLQQNIHSSIDALGRNTLIVQKWPIMFVDDYPWWKFINRPINRYHEFEKLKADMQADATCCLLLNYQADNFKYESNTVTTPGIIAVTQNYEKIRNIEIAYGRYFSELDFFTGSNAAVIGADIADGLFRSPEEAIGKTIKLDGKKVVVIGVLKREGSNLLQTSLDAYAIMTYNYIRTVVAVGHNYMEPNIYVKPVDNVSIDYVKDEVRKNMRAVRRLSPGVEDNFAINEFSMITTIFDSMFKVLWIVGTIVGLFSIIVGCFGVANIMFVSVKERTNLIGIQKALGAKNNFILIQFMVEAIVLCLMGAIVGLVLVGIAVGFARLLDYGLILSWFNIAIAFIIAFTIGILAGIIPAYQASRLDPVEAIRSK